MTRLLIPSRGNSIVLSFASLCSSFVVVLINFKIYTARWQFSGLRPDYVKREPPTISRAISVPEVGEPFASWMLICAPLLFVSIALCLMVVFAEMTRSGAVSKATLKKVALLGGAIVTLQALASAGMIVLSQYTFPNHGPMHMNGSYLFFFSQAVVVLVGEMLSGTLDKLPPAGRLTVRRGARARRMISGGVVVLAVLYLALFVGKDFVSGPLEWPVLQTYVTIELLLISAFLIYFWAWTPDMILAVGRYLRSVRSAARSM